ncbi:tyrosine--tRNA ligase, cytoplasmic [Coffea eugenioides]|uniref:tyrosine--tRNA ligase, cytoplasmic n=1 Tax=Coffea eugenioides TaxID=49369 RepID=UPI000F613198|nr:tyrosine--tRNA ligase, cytoplasmic [Coffea eugenioides]
MGLGGSMSLLRGGCSSSSSSSGGYCCCSSSSSNYGYGGRRPVLLRALLPSATASATSSSTPRPLQPLLLLRPRDKKKTIILTPPFSTSPPTNPNYSSSSSSWATPKKLTPPFLLPSPLITKFTPVTPIPTLLPGWKRCFCTAPSSSSSSVKVEDDDDDEMTKIKEAANTLDIRVGKILKAWRHQEADSLYVEEVDVGEPEPRIICSGLVKYLPLHHLQGINVVVLANLKPRNMRGVKSSGMLMAASDASHENVELLVPPEGSVPGQRIWFGSVDEKENLPDAASPNQIQKKKIWEQVQPHLGTDDSCIAALGMHTMRTTDGVVVCRSLKNARIS